MKKIKNIIVGWYRMIFGKKMSFAENRKIICSKCSYREKFAGMYFCTKCGCVIDAKVEVEDEICLDGRWPDIKND